MVVAGCAEYKVPIAIDKEQHSNQESYFIPGLDHGLIQSPINILSAEIKASKGHGITLHFQDKINAIKNLGYTVQLDFDKGSTVSSDGREYELKQMHFHTPSEHLIDGMTFPMELHIVNQVPPLNESDTPHYLVIAALFKMGKENKFISDFLSTTPSFYHYRGSLTTKPYTESVSWFVLKRIIEASPEQIRTINKIEGDNARHIQNKFGRTID